MTDVRSQRLSHLVSQADTYLTAWRSPAGTVTLFKSCVVWNSSQAAATGELVLASGGTVTTIWSKALEALEAFEWQGWIALNPDDAVAVRSDTTFVHFWSSGAVLAGGPPYPPSPGDILVLEAPAPLPAEQ